MIPMRWGSRRAAWLAVLASVLVIAGAASALVLTKSEKPVDRTIELSMKDYTFNESNPTLKLEAGERVRVVVRNDEVDENVLHMFRIPGMTGVSCESWIKPGEQREFVFDVPKSGEYVYVCCSHPGMGGDVRIARTSAATGASPATVGVE